MGLFNSTYNRPGPGVSKDMPKDNRFVHYWKIYGRHFWDLMKLNLLFAVPAILLLVLCLIVDSATKSMPFNMFLAGLPLIFLSPFVAGLTYETRNFIREEHVFILNDYFDKIKENWKQFLANGIVCYIVYEVLTLALHFYLNTSTEQKMGTVLSVVAIALCFAVLLIFTIMQFYIPLEIVTFDMKLRQMYKNAGIFAVAALGWNLLAFILSLFLVGLLYLFIVAGAIVPLALIIIVLLAVFFLWSFWSYTVNSLVYPTINRLMIQPALKKSAAENNNGEADHEETPAFTDWDSISDEDDDEDDDEEED